MKLNAAWEDILFSLSKENFRLGKGLVHLGNESAGHVFSFYLRAASKNVQFKKTHQAGLS